MKFCMLTSSNLSLRLAMTESRVCCMLRESEVPEVTAASSGADMRFCARSDTPRHRAETKKKSCFFMVKNYFSGTKIQKIRKLPKESADFFRI